MSRSAVALLLPKCKGSGARNTHTKGWSQFSIPFIKVDPIYVSVDAASPTQVRRGTSSFWILRRLKKNIWGDYCSNYLILRLKVSFGGRLVLFSRAGVIFSLWDAEGWTGCFTLLKSFSISLPNLLVFLRCSLPVNIVLLFPRAPGNHLACDSALLTLASLCVIPRHENYLCGPQVM